MGAVNLKGTYVVLFSDDSHADVRGASCGRGGEANERPRFAAPQAGEISSGLVSNTTVEIASAA